jgi:hypothetical protein
MDSMLKLKENITTRYNSRSDEEVFPKKTLKTVAAGIAFKSVNKRYSLCCQSLKWSTTCGIIHQETSYGETWQQLLNMHFSDFNIRIMRFDIPRAFRCSYCSLFV